MQKIIWGQGQGKKTTKNDGRLFCQYITNRSFFSPPTQIFFTELDNNSSAFSVNCPEYFAPPKKFRFFFGILFFAAVLKMKKDNCKTLSGHFP